MSRADRALDHLQHRLQVLADVEQLGDGRLPAAMSAQIAELRQRATARLNHGSAFTVVALAGATGSGKSSTFNALAGREIATVGVRRPTTSVAQALVFVDDPAADPAGALLDWLNVPTRQVIHDPALAGLVLLDLPDHDSVVAAHRAEVDRLAEVVDVFCWVVDPQKYADAALHHGYLRSLSTHANVTVVVMNKIDTLAAESREPALADLRRLLGEAGMADGQGGVRVLAASATTGDGLDALRRELAARVQERRAIVARLEADIDWIGQHLQAGVAAVGVRAVGGADRDRLVDALSAAAGVDAVAGAVGAHHRQSSRQVAGWPPTRWMARLKPDPLRRLGLGRSAPGDRASATVVARTSLGEPSPMAEANVDAAVRQVVDSVAAGMSPDWQQRVATVARQRRRDLTDALDRAVAGTDLPAGQPRWWSVAGLVQRLATLVMVVGLVWLLATAVVAWFQLPDLPTVKVGAVPLPTLLAIGGAALGLLVALLARWAAGVSAQARAATARRRMRRSIEAVADELLIAPINAELASMATLTDQVRSLTRP